MSPFKNIMIIVGIVVGLIIAYLQFKTIKDHLDVLNTDVEDVKNKIDNIL